MYRVKNGGNILKIDDTKFSKIKSLKNLVNR